LLNYWGAFEKFPLNHWCRILYTNQIRIRFYMRASPW